MHINDDEEIVFSTGHIEPACMGVIGLGMDDANKFWVATGFDNNMYYEDTLTLEEKVELADYMIDLWQKFKSDINFKPKT